LQRLSEEELIVIDEIMGILSEGKGAAILTDFGVVSEFDEIAHKVFVEQRHPESTFKNVWVIFQAMVSEIEEMYEYEGSDHETDVNE
jgi:hypothetical protein